MITRRKIRVTRRHGFALIEVLVAVLFVGVFMLSLLQVRNQALHQFIQSDDQFTGAWLAEMKMAELVAQQLPDPEDEDTWIMDDYGDFGHFDGRTNDINRTVNEDWVDRTTFAKFEYEWTKELIFIGPDFIGTAEDLDMWEPPLDPYGEVDPLAKDPREEAAARVVRITLTVYLPERRQRDSEGEITDRKSIRLVTYVDPSILFEAEPATDDATETGR